MIHRPTRSHFPRHRLLVQATILATATLSFGWSASGAVKSTAGSPISGAVVVRSDSTAHKTTTDGAGKFTLEFTSGIQDRIMRDIDMRVRMEGTDIVVRIPVDGPVRLSLVDAKGRVAWSVDARSEGGVAKAAMPAGLGRQALWLRVRYAQGGFEQAALSTGNGLRTAKMVTAARAMATRPVLKFSKAGFHDTTYSMVSDVEPSLAIVMRDSAPATTCPATKLAAGDQNKTIKVKGVDRAYILHVPSAYKGDSPVPMVVDFHPIMGTASGQQGSTTYKSKTDPEGVISLYPEGLKSPLNNGQAWNVKGCCTTADDTAFVRAMVAEVKKVACIDPKRVYATGFSMGGGMTHYSACHLADIFAAGAPAAFDLIDQNVADCKPVRPLTMIMFRGTSDGTVSYAGGHSAVVPGMAIDFLGAKKTFAKWAEIDKCTGSPSAEDSNGCSTYSNCEGGVQVTLCTKQGGGHEQGNGAYAWPILKKYTLP